MGGKGSGGARAGSGRKPKDAATRWLEGSARTKAAAKSAVPVIEEFDAPDDLTRDERLVWLDLAPHAFVARTLTRASAFAFKLLCRNIVLERALSQDAEERGRANHRGIIQRIDAELARFCLSPMGKPLMVDAPKDDDPFAQFDGAVN